MDETLKINREVPKTICQQFKCAQSISQYFRDVNAEVVR